MIYRIIQEIEGHMIASDVKPENLGAWLSVRGMQVTGIERRTNLRPELQGQPKISGLCGPMWSGEPNVIRYESTAAYAEFSK